MPKKKRPTREFDPPAGKRPCSLPIERAANPSWQFSILDWDGPFGWSNVSGEELRRIHHWMSEIEQLSWREIFAQQSRGNSKHHYIPLDRIGKVGRARLETLRQSDIDELFSFRLDEARRIWGIVDRHVFKVLWWDPDHQVYPMNLADN